MQHSNSRQYHNRDLKKRNFVVVVIESFTVLTGFVLSLSKQMPNNLICEELLTHEVKSDFRPRGETGESLTWESVLPFPEENLGYLHYVVKVES